jgi:toxin ParE1/3/4
MITSLYPAARKLLPGSRCIVTSVQGLTAFPMSGRPGRMPGTREPVISNSPFIAAYTIEKTRIVILALYHGAQQWPEVF